MALLGSALLRDARSSWGMGKKKSLLNFSTLCRKLGENLSRNYSRRVCGGTLSPSKDEKTQAGKTLA